MSDKNSILKAFNNHFFEFLNEIIDIFPEKNEIREAKTAFETFKRVNPTSIVKVWFQYVYIPYITIIQDGDISFFLEKNYSDDLSILQNSKDIMKVIDKIRDPIKSMSDKNKDCSMKYIQNLSKLSELYSQLSR